MSHRIRRPLTLGFLVAALALFVLPAVTLAAPHQPQARLAARTSTTTVSFAFAGQVTKGQLSGLPLAGGITIALTSNGAFKGTFHLPGNVTLPVAGQVSSDRSLVIRFLVPGVSNVYINGEGRPNSIGEYVGPFQVYAAGSQIGTGIWSALPVAHPTAVLSYQFIGATQSGPDSGAAYFGALVLSKSNLTGTLNLPSGVVVRVSAKLSKNTITVTFNLGKGAKIVGTGTANNQGFSGTYMGPRKGDTGQWVAYSFGY